VIVFVRIERGLSGDAVNFSFEGRSLVGRAGDTLAGALLAAGVLVTRMTPVKGSPRAPYCMMGACYDCLVEVDGRPNQQACMLVLSEGMDVRIQSGSAELVL
jgi:predicted molibdopterin-dependent oxidoreductase YjgC